MHFQLVKVTTVEHLSFQELNFPKKLKDELTV